MFKKELTCIVCPKGCKLTITTLQDTYTVSGNSCKRGIEYGINETKNPVRKVTSTVRIRGGVYPRLPVITRKAIPKASIFKVMEELNRIEVFAPINCGDVIIENIANTNVDLIATRSMNKKSS